VKKQARSVLSIYDWLPARVLQRLSPLSACAWALDGGWMARAYSL
jgi:hypothetical protein